MLLSTYLLFSRVVLANKNVYITRNQRQGSKLGTRQTRFLSSFFFFSSSSVRLALQPLQWWWSITHQTERNPCDWCLFYLDYSKTERASQYFWTLESTGSQLDAILLLLLLRNSYNCLMSKHNHRKPSRRFILQTHNLDSQNKYTNKYQKIS